VLVVQDNEALGEARSASKASIDDPDRPIDAKDAGDGYRFDTGTPVPRWQLTSSYETWSKLPLLLHMVVLLFDVLPFKACGYVCRKT
jgi:hypothetical protein